ncbi:MAG: hypothetical protein IH877_04765 [Gemmatimonadetes bacterium]|nr:hypothetical protein [Gemmatimonadota bacterium]
MSEPFVSIEVGEARAQQMTRREVLEVLAAVGLGLFGVSACTPARILLRDYPAEFDTEPLRVDRTLRAFVTAVVPGMDPSEANLVRAFYDSYFPLEPHRNFLAAELSRYARERYGRDRFDLLPYEHRVRVIQDGLDEGGIIARIFGGAVFLTQIACYSGIYDDEQGCSLVDFEGRYRVRPISETSYDHPERFLPTATTVDGNPA